MFLQNLFLFYIITALSIFLISNMYGLFKVSWPRFQCFLVFSHSTHAQDLTHIAMVRGIIFCHSPQDFDPLAPEFFKNHRTPYP